MQRTVLTLCAALLTSPAAAQDYAVGRDGWQVERLSDRFVLLRSEIERIGTSERSGKGGLLILTCDHQARRIRFQIGETPRQPSTRPADSGRAFVRGDKNGQPLRVAPFHPKVRFFDDGSFEFVEAIGFDEPVMRNFIHLLEREPTALEVVLYKGSDTGRFVRGTPIRFTLERINEHLIQIYGFEGLCFRSLE